MAKYENNLERMMYLMSYDNSLNESQKTVSGIECHRTGADGKEYGIIKEGRKFYIKVSTPEKQNIAESYDYINGYNYRNENGYNSYNEATKQLEARLMSLNEAAGKHEDVSIANLDKTRQALNILTEDTRKELDRMHAIFENSFISKENIGNHGNPEGKGTATASNTTKNNAPFDEKATVSLDKDMKENGTVEKATPDNKGVKDADSKLQHADKMEKGKKGNEGYKAAHDDLDGEGVADKQKNGGKAVKMNEELEEFYQWDEDEDGFETPEEDPVEDFTQDDTELPVDGEEEAGLETEPSVEDGFDEEDPVDEEPIEDEPVGLGDEENDDLDDLLREFLDEPSEESSDVMEENEDECCGQGIEEGCEELDGPHGSGNSVHGEKTMDKMDESDEATVEGGNATKNKIVGPEKTLDGPHGSGNSVHGEKTMDKMNEAINRITNMVFEEICKCCGKETCNCEKPKKKKKETLQETIQRLVKEETTKLNAWGKHPKYRKAPMTLPDNHEVLKGTAKGDWNDDSTKGSAPYGSKIGSSAPFDKQVDMITDQVLANLKESLRLGK